MESGTLSPNPSSAVSNGDRRPQYIVGIGASAGGLEALERLFEKMPTQTGLAFVVIQHLSPDFKSLTDELLARRTRIPIHSVESGVDMERDTIYLLPPRKDMIAADGKLLLTDKDPGQVPALPIDRFFRSLAQEAGPRAVGIILSGTGSDGSRGIRDIHDAGGFVLAQSVESAKFDGMPKSAVQTGAVNFSVSPEEMPAALLRYIDHPLAEQLAPANQGEVVPKDAMASIFRLLRDAYDIDFSHYKPDTVSRRTDRRLQLNHSTDLEQYVDKLSKDPEELNKLYKDLLIGVTRFFRDREVFDRLEKEVLPELIRKLPPEEELRVWVAGCATGEEAYSLAILVQEAFEAAGRPTSAKIFATDVHRASLDTASASVYSKSSLADVGPQRLQRHFVQKSDGYQICADLRRLVVFAHHNVIKDAPFTRLSLVSCRNLLIYFQPPAQRKALAMFHFGLKAGGVMVLGPSESPAELSEEFETLDVRWKVYRKRRDVRLPPEIRLTAAPPLTASAWSASLPTTGPSVDAQLLGAYDALLDKFMPPSLLISERRDVLHVFGSASNYLQPREGRFTCDVLEMIHRELRVALSGALQRVFKEQVPVVYKNLRLPTSSGVQMLHLTVEPVRNHRSSQAQALIAFEELGDAPPVVPMKELDLGRASTEHVSSLEHELRYTKENLQATIEELETSNEELQATNEELVASNEELQSTNEELHSVNEELYTVNGEYQKKIGELTEITTDMENLLTCTQVHIIFLDRELRIRKFTPSIGDAFNLLPQDVGRKIDSFTHGIDHPELMDNLRSVLATGKSIEKQVRDHHGAWFLLRVLPYRAGAAIDGVLLTLVNISSLKQAESDARYKDHQLRAILKTSPNFLFMKDLHGRYTLADESYRQRLGTDPIGKTVYDVYPRDIAERIDAEDRRVLCDGVARESELQVSLPGGTHTYLCNRFPVLDENGRIIGVSGIKTDITQFKHAEKQAQDAVVQRDRFLAMLSHELRNPLGAVLNATRLVQAKGIHDQSAGNWFQVIERRSLHMARLLDDLLDISRITRNKIEIRRTHFDLATTLSDVLEEVQSHFQERQLRLHVTRPTEPLPLNGDAGRLQQIQVNLLLNAAKYTPMGGEVWYSMTKDSGQALIRVKDSGCGIAADMLEKIFDLFVQVDSKNDRVGSGIGVGLTLVRAIVELHGGRVRAQSSGVGEGSEFIVRLPLDLRPLVAVPAQVPHRRPTSIMEPPRLLLVEDDRDIRESMVQLLELEGYPVTAVETAHAALAEIERRRPDVALIDIGLPDLTGYQLARRIRERWAGEALFLAALTGYGRKSDQRAAIRAGFNAHLTKPLNFPELFKLLDEQATPQGTKVANLLEKSN